MVAQWLTMWAGHLVHSIETLSFKNVGNLHVVPPINTQYPSRKQKLNRKIPISSIVNFWMVEW